MTKSFSLIEIWLNGEVVSETIRPLVSIQNQQICRADRVLLVDGGVRHVAHRKWDGESVAWIGDGDSVNISEMNNTTASIKKQGGNLTVRSLPSDKSLSDFAAALDSIEGSKFGTEPLMLKLFGCSGGRFDHELITYQEIVNWVGSRTNPTIAVADFGVVTSFPVEIFLAKGSTFSILTQGGTNPIFLSGARYSGDIVLQRPSHGLSNISEAPPVVLDPRNQIAVLLWNLTAETVSK